MTSLAAGSCLADSHAWICGEYLRTYSGVIQHALYQHISLTATALGFAMLIAIPLTALATWKRWLRAGIMATLGVIYTIPSLALFVLLQPYLGIGHATPVVIALVAYAQLLLIRNVLVGFDGVPEEAIEAARGLGYGPVDLVLKVRLPLALPAILAGLRVTTVSTIALLTIGGLIGQGGLGTLLNDGFQRDIYAQILVSLVLIVVLGDRRRPAAAARPAHALSLAAGAAMSLIGKGVTWLNDVQSYKGSDGVIHLAASHLEVTVISMGLAAAVSLPIGIALGHIRRGGPLVTLLANATRAVPTLGLLYLLAEFPTFGVSRKTAIISLAIFAIPPDADQCVGGRIDGRRRSSRRGTRTRNEPVGDSLASGTATLGAADLRRGAQFHLADVRDGDDRVVRRHRHARQTHPAGAGRGSARSG